MKPTQTATIQLDGINFDVEYKYHPAIPGSYLDPEDPYYVEILKITTHEDLSELLSDKQYSKLEELTIQAHKKRIEEGILEARLYALDR